MSGSARPVAGGGRAVEVPAGRLAGWVNRFADRHGGVTELTAGGTGVVARAADGATAELAAPFPPMACEDAAVEAVEALLAHIEGIGDVGLILVRERAYSIGVCRDGQVVISSTDTRYVQSRTAAGGWSQQRYARRRGNQRRDSYRAAADAAARVLGDHRGSLAALVVAGDRTAIEAVMDDPRLAWLQDLPTRTFHDIAEPRRAVLDEVAARAYAVTITIRDAEPTSGT